MKKLLLLTAATAMLASTMASAGTAEDQSAIKMFLENTFKTAPVKLGGLKFKPGQDVSESSWKAYQVEITVVAPKGQTRVSRILFTDGKFVAGDLFQVSKKDNLSVLLAPSIDKEEYTKARHVAGNDNAEHKVIVYSDPLCPFCINTFPKIYDLADKHPDKIGLYLVHNPLVALHPAAPALSKAMVAAKAKGIKNSALKVYGSKVNPKMTDEAQILAALKKDTGIDLTVEDINTPEVLSEMKKDAQSTTKYMVEGTPIIFLDGKKIVDLRVLMQAAGETAK